MGTSLVIHWLGVCLPVAGDMGSIPGWGSKSPHAMGQLSPCMSMHTTILSL